ncbi:hypothetical protein NPIL_239241 [Nephila pilipes]|uniref:Uncharacterized protein n=1 Tax=Nephila pilipes TaxID=299642 RepID=A0A8X6IZP7_NEPPI|nr:hypothetical protein NPIL_239241 [Nephila pilipes]
MSQKGKEVHKSLPSSLINVPNPLRLAGGRTIRLLPDLQRVRSIRLVTGRLMDFLDASLSFAGTVYLSFSSSFLCHLCCGRELSGSSQLCRCLRTRLQVLLCLLAIQQMATALSAMAALLTYGSLLCKARRISGTNADGACGQQKLPGLTAMVFAASYSSGRNLHYKFVNTKA